MMDLPRPHHALYVVRTPHHTPAVRQPCASRAPAVHVPRVRADHAMPRVLPPGPSECACGRAGRGAVPRPWQREPAGVGQRGEAGARDPASATSGKPTRQRDWGWHAAAGALVTSQPGRGAVGAAGDGGRARCLFPQPRRRAAAEHRGGARPPPERTADGARRRGARGRARPRGGRGRAAGVPSQAAGGGRAATDEREQSVHSRSILGAQQVYHGWVRKYMIAPPLVP